MKKWNNQKTEELLRAVLSLKNLEESKSFFRDLLTEKELVEFGNRWQAAQMLEKKITYAEIGKKTGLSPRTIARISKWLNGKLGGYKSGNQKNQPS
jgi:TrpR-related protein YerC/YecD